MALNNLFDTALATIFNSVVSETVTLITTGGDTLTVQAVVSEPDVVSELSQSRLRQPQELFEIRRADAPAIGKGDIIVRADNSAYRVMAARFKDSRRAIWLCECAETFLPSAQLNFALPANSGFLALVAAAALSDDLFFN